MWQHKNYIFKEITQSLNINLTCWANSSKYVSCVRAIHEKQNFYTSISIINCCNFTIRSWVTTFMYCLYVAISVTWTYSQVQNESNHKKVNIMTSSLFISTILYSSNLFSCREKKMLGLLSSYLSLRFCCSILE